MNENVKPVCICELGCDKGALKKTIENNVFTIYGNIIKDNYIILRYHGELIDNIAHNNYQNNLYISYYFDGNINQKQTICLAKCSKCIGESYCTLIHLEKYNNINFSFFLLQEKQSTYLYGNDETSFTLDIGKNTLTDFLQKYDIEENSNLPIMNKSNNLQIKKIINNIKNFFLSLINKAGTI